MKRYFNAYMQPKKTLSHPQYVKNSYKSLWETENSVVYWAKTYKGNLKRYMQMTNKHMKGTQLD